MHLAVARHPRWITSATAISHVKIYIYYLHLTFTTFFPLGVSNVVCFYLYFRNIVGK